MLIGDKYKLESDERNITLHEKLVMTGERVPSAKGKEIWRAIAYFGTPQNALDYLVDKEIMETGFKDFETVCKKQDELYQLIQGLPNELLPQLKE